MNRFVVHKSGYTNGLTRLDSKAANDFQRANLFKPVWWALLDRRISFATINRSSASCFWITINILRIKYYVHRIIIHVVEQVVIQTTFCCFFVPCCCCPPRGTNVLLGLFSFSFLSDWTWTMRTHTEKRIGKMRIMPSISLKKVKKSAVRGMEPYEE